EDTKEWRHAESFLRATGVSEWASLILHARPRPAHRLGDVRRMIRLERRMEQLGEMTGATLVIVAIGAGFVRTQEIRRHIGTILRRMQTKVWFRRKRDAIERAGEDRAHHGARVRQRDAPAAAKGAAGPTGVDQPDLAAVQAHTFGQQFGVTRRGQW